MTTAAEIKSGLDCGRSGCSCRSNGKTHCPVDVHEDRNPSFSVSDKGGKVLVHCFSGCDQDDAIAALRDKGLWSAATERAYSDTDGLKGKAGQWQLVREFPHGSPVVAVKGRFENGARDEDGKALKEYKWRLPNGDYDRGLDGKLTEEDIPLYRSDLLEAYPEAGVILVEGQVAAEAAIANKLIALSLPGGAKSTKIGRSLEPLRTREVWLWPDNDEEGRKLMRRVKEHLPHARYVRLPDDWPPKADAVEYFDAGHDAADLFRPRLRSMALLDFLAGGTERAPDVVAPIVAPGITIGFSGPGEMKTLFAVELAYTKATGRSNLPLEATPGRALFVQTDMSDDFRVYMHEVANGREEEAAENLRVWMPETALFLDEPEGAEMLRDEVRNFSAELVFIDHLGTVIGSDGWTGKDLRPALDVIRQLRRDGVAVYLLDQTRKESGGGTKTTAPTIDTLYGGRAKSALADRAWHFKKQAGSDTVVLTPAKERGASQKPFTATFGPDGWSATEGAGVNLTPAAQKVLAAIVAAPHNKPPTKIELQLITHLSERAVDEAVKMLLYLDQIEKGPRRQGGRSDTYMLKRHRPESEALEQAYFERETR